MPSALTDLLDAATQVFHQLPPGALGLIVSGLFISFIVRFLVRVR